MKSSQWYRRNYGLIILFGIGIAAFAYAHVDLIEPGLANENIMREMEKQDRSNDNRMSDEEFMEAMRAERQRHDELMQECENMRNK